jgi:hypothetical protein
MNFTQSREATMMHSFPKPQPIIPHPKAKRLLSTNSPTEMVVFKENVSG